MVPVNQYGEMINPALTVSIGSAAVAVAAFVRAGRWRAQDRRAIASRLEVIVRPGYASGPEGNLVLGDVDVIIQNISTMVVTLTELGIAPTDFTGPLTILSGYRSSFAKTINSGSFFYYTSPVTQFALPYSLSCS